MRAVLSARVTSIPKEGEHLRLEAGHKNHLVLLVTGIGPVNASMALGHLLGGLVRPLGVLSLGVAGAFDLEELPLGQAVVVQEEIWPEYGLVTEEGIDPQGIGLALGKIDGRPIWDRISLNPGPQAQHLGLLLPDIPQTLSLTVSGVSGTAQRAAFLRFRYGAAIENMEGFALAWTCARLKIPFLEVRTISNLVGSRKTEHWDLRKALARLGEVAKTILPEI
jgi:futalosine hydrolase